MAREGIEYPDSWISRLGCGVKCSINKLYSLVSGKIGYVNTVGPDTDGKVEIVSDTSNIIVTDDPSNHRVHIDLDAGLSSPPVTSVNGQTGAVVLTEADFEDAVVFSSVTSGYKEMFTIAADALFTNVSADLVILLVDKSNHMTSYLTASFITGQLAPELYTDNPALASRFFITVDVSGNVAVWGSPQRIYAKAIFITRANNTTEYAVKDHVQIGTDVQQNKPVVGSTYTYVVNAVSQSASVSDVNTAIAAETSARQSQDAAIISQINTLDTGCVHLTGTETITGDKTFSGTTAFNGTVTVPTVATGTSDTQAANGTKVSNELDAYSAMVRTTGAQTIAGIKTFTTNRGITCRVNNYATGVSMVSPADDYTMVTSGEINYPYIDFRDSNGVQCGILRFNHNGSVKKLEMLILDKSGTWHSTTIATYTDS